MRVSTQEKIDAAVSVLSDRKIETQIYVIQGASGELEAEIRLNPTDRVAEVALLLAQEGLNLHYDGKNVRVISPAPSQPLQPEQPDGPKVEIPPVTSDAITQSAVEYAMIVGLPPADLVKQKIGTGKDGRVTKQDVITHVNSKVSP